MPADLLSDRAVQSAIKSSIAQERPYKISDGGGLLLEARPNGSGWWRYRYRFAGAEQMISLGTYPQVSLREARSARDAAKRQVHEGTNPSATRKSARTAALSEREAEKLRRQGKPLPGSFEYVARDWVSRIHSAKVSEGHSARTLTRFENDAFPDLGVRPLADIDAPELLKCIRKVEARGALETAHRLKDACGQVFRYGIATGQCSRNPAADLRDALRPVPTKHFAALFTPKEVSQLLKDMDGYQGHVATRAALSLSAMLLLRPGELRSMEWQWVDIEKEQITVPSSAMKRRRAGKESGPPHIVPLATQAIQVLKELEPHTRTGKYVFPALTSKLRCMSENTVRSALRRLGYDNDEMTAHGFRAMARTMAAERLGIDPLVIEAQLAHSVPDSLGRAYNRTQYLEQRKQLMQAWANYLDNLRKEKSEDGRV